MLAVRASRCFGVRHCARTAAPAVLLATSETIAGYEVVEHKGIATGSTVRTKDIAQDMFSAFRGMFGGELTRYTTLLQDSREEALSRLQEDAASRGHGERPADRLSEAAHAEKADQLGSMGHLGNCCASGIARNRTESPGIAAVSPLYRRRL